MLDVPSNEKRLACAEMHISFGSGSVENIRKGIARLGRVLRELI